MTKQFHMLWKKEFQVGARKTSEVINLNNLKKNYSLFINYFLVFSPNLLILFRFSYFSFYLITQFLLPKWSAPDSSNVMRLTVILINCFYQNHKFYYFSLCIRWQSNNKRPPYRSKNFSKVVNCLFFEVFICIYTICNIKNWSNVIFKIWHEFYETDHDNNLFSKKRKMIYIKAAS